MFMFVCAPRKMYNSKSRFKIHKIIRLGSNTEELTNKFYLGYSPFNGTQS